MTVPARVVDLQFRRHRPRRSDLAIHGLYEVVALLEDRALFFPRIAQLDDPFEGSFPAGQPLLNRLMDLLPPEQFLPELWSICRRA